MTDQQLRFLKANKEMLISLFEVRRDELAKQLLDTMDDRKSIELKIQATEDKAWITIINNYYDKKEAREDKKFTGI